MLDCFFFLIAPVVHIWQAPRTVNDDTEIAAGRHHPTIKIRITKAIHQIIIKVVVQGDMNHIEQNDRSERIVPELVIGVILTQMVARSKDGAPIVRVRSSGSYSNSEHFSQFSYW